MKQLIITSSAFLILLLTQSLMIMKKDGAAPGYTGSPGDSLKNCTACHGGTAVEVIDWVESDIPPEGYVPGQTYTIKASNNEFGATRFGFEVSPQDTLGNLMGTILVTDNLRTKLVGDSKYITYTENGVEGVNTLSWTFKWVAPKSDKDVTFYGAFNSNHNGDKGGDRTYLSTHTVKRNKALSVEPANKLEAVKIYPNPTCEYVLLKFETKVDCTVTADILDLNGKQVSLLLDNRVINGVFEQQFDIHLLPSGIYFVRLNQAGQVTTQKLEVLR